VLWSVEFAFAPDRFARWPFELISRFAALLLPGVRFDFTLWPGLRFISAHVDRMHACTGGRFDAAWTRWPSTKFNPALVFALLNRNAGNTTRRNSNLGRHLFQWDVERN